MGAAVKCLEHIERASLLDRIVWELSVALGDVSPDDFEAVIDVDPLVLVRRIVER